MVTIGLKGLANFMSASLVRRRSVLRDYKYYSQPGPAQAIYYGEARNALVEYYQGRHEPPWLFAQAEQFDGLAEQSAGQTRAMYRNNARGLRLYARHFGDRRYELLEDLELSLTFGDVVVTVRPDLHAMERRRRKLIRLEFSKTPPTETTIHVVTRGLYEAARQAGLDVGPSGGVYLDVPRGQAHTGGPLGARLQREVQAACETIAAIWDNL